MLTRYVDCKNVIIYYFQKMSKPCKFYIQGFCRNGGGCTFLHTQVTNQQHGNILKNAAETKSGEINHDGQRMSSRWNMLLQK